MQAGPLWCGHCAGN